MTLGFLVLRKGFLKVMGATIQAALDRGHTVVLVWDPGDAKPGELVTDAELSMWPGARRTVYRRGTPLAPVLQAAGVEALISPSLYALIQALPVDRADVEAIRRAGIRLYSVDYSLETASSPAAGYEVVDTTFYVSGDQRQLHWRLMQDEFAALGPAVDRVARSAVCGSTMLDQLAVVDRAAVRARYGLASGRPVVLFMSLKMAVPEPWRRLLWGARPWPWRALQALASGHHAWARDIVLEPHGYRRLAEALRAFCDRIGAALIVKSREKNEDPAFLRELADVFVYDERVYPYTSMELMAIASLCVHFDSGAVVEAAFAGVPSLTVAVPQDHLRPYVYFDELYGGRPGSMQNFAGVVWRLTPEEAIRTLGHSTLAGFAIDAEARRRYLEIFQGFDDTRSSARVLDTIERAAAALAGPAARPELFRPNDLSLAQPTFVAVDDPAVLAEIRSVLTEYADGDRAVEIERFAGTTVLTRNYRVRLPAGRLLLKSRDGAAEERRLLDEAALAERLLARGVPVPRLVRTRDQRRLVVRGERRWVAHVFEEGGYFQATVGELRSAAEAFARLTRAASEGRPPDTLEASETRFLSELDALLQPDAAPAAAELLRAEGPRLRATLAIVRARRQEVESPVALVHTDFHPLNFLVQGGQVRCLLDMEDVKPYPVLAALGFASFKLVRQMWTRPAIRERAAPATVLQAWLDGWHAVFGERRYSVELLGLGARYRVLALIHMILDLAGRGQPHFLYDLAKQVGSLEEIDVLYGALPAAGADAARGEQP